MLPFAKDAVVRAIIDNMAMMPRNMALMGLGCRVLGEFRVHKCTSESTSDLELGGHSFQNSSGTCHVKCIPKGSYVVPFSRLLFGKGL